MIATLTPNPSVDRTLTVRRLVRGAVLRATSGWSEPSGKGVNVALALRGHGQASRAVLPIGGSEGARLETMLLETGLDYLAVPIKGEVRSNVSVLEPDGTVTKMNEPGPVLTAAELTSLIEVTVRAGAHARWIVGCGSLPTEAPATFYADLVEAGHDIGVPVAIDTSGPPMAAALKAGPDLVKPNAEELAEAAGHPVRTLGDALKAARRLQEMGAKSVLASLGPDGAVLVEDGEAIHGEAHVAEPRNTVGAGDALLAGFLSAGAQGPKALETALAWSAAAVQQTSTLLHATPAEPATSVTLHGHLDLDRKLGAGSQ